MTPPTVLVNTYIKCNEKPVIDCVSKIFIISGWFFGLNRLPIFGNIHIVVLIFSLLPTVLFVGHYSFFLYNVSHVAHLSLIIMTHYVQWAFVVLFNLISIQRLKGYYNELNAFDNKVGCSPKIAKVSIKNLVITVLLLLFMLITFVVPEITVAFIRLYVSAMPFTLCIIQEVHYYGHLLSLLLPRLRLINYYMELSLSNCKIPKDLNIEQFGYSKADSNKSLCEMEKLLITLICIFLVILMSTFKLSLCVIHNDNSLFSVITFMLLWAGLMLSLFSPCILGDQVRYEVTRLRELLTLRIYENQMDVCSRLMAQALLAWTRTRSLSFKLLRMLDIDISLPFKFIGLLVTYLIILLQFQKIIDPDA